MQLESTTQVILVLKLQQSRVMDQMKLTKNKIFFCIKDESSYSTICKDKSSFSFLSIKNKKVVDKSQDITSPRGATHESVDVICVALR